MTNRERVLEEFLRDLTDAVENYMDFPNDLDMDRPVRRELARVGEVLRGDCDVNVLVLPMLERDRIEQLRRIDSLKDILSIAFTGWSVEEKRELTEHVRFLAETHGVALPKDNVAPIAG